MHSSWFFFSFFFFFDLFLCFFFQQVPAHALSSPDLLSKCQSTPDLVSTNINRYKLAVAKRELQNKNCSCLVNNGQLLNGYSKLPQSRIPQQNSANIYDVPSASTSRAPTGCSYVVSFCLAALMQSRSKNIISRTIQS